MKTVNCHICGRPTDGTHTCVIKRNGESKEYAVCHVCKAMRASFLEYLKVTRAEQSRNSDSQSLHNEKEKYI